MKEEERNNIISDFQGGMNISDIAKKYKVSRRTVQFTIYPERRKRNVDLLNKRGGWRLYYDNEKQKKRRRESKQTT